MSFVLFFRGMIAVLVVFAAAIFFLTGSFWTAFWQTLVCAVLLQVGYFVVVLVMVSRAEAKGARDSTAKAEASPLSRAEDVAADEPRKLPGAPFSHRP